MSSTSPTEPDFIQSTRAATAFKWVASTHRVSSSGQHGPSEAGHRDSPSSNEQAVPTPPLNNTPSSDSSNADSNIKAPRRQIPPHPYPFAPAPLNPVKPPIRLIVSSITNLVPGIDHTGRVLFLLNKLAWYHFGTWYEVGKHRYYTRKTLFGYPWVRCWVCLDYGQVECRQKDVDVKVVAYKWVGGDLIPDPFLPYRSTARHLLNNVYPFTRPQDPALLTPSGKPKKPINPFLPRPYARSTPPIRVAVRNKLRYGRVISREEIDYMRAHLEEVQWLGCEGGLPEFIVKRFEVIMWMRWRALKREEEERRSREKAKAKAKANVRWVERITSKFWNIDEHEEQLERDIEAMVPMGKRKRMEDVMAKEVEVEKKRMTERRERMVKGARMERWVKGAKGMENREEVKGVGGMESSWLIV